jgi:hypothetical protein
LTAYVLKQNGDLADSEGAVVSLSIVPVEHVAVPQLSSHVETFELAHGGIVKVRIIYSSHCWSRKHDTDADGGSIKFMDGIRPRTFCLVRYGFSLDLRRLVQGLPRNKIYMTSAERNFGTYCATEMLEDGSSYTAFFTIRRGQGRFDGVRHQLTMHIESAYFCAQPDPKGQKTGFSALINSALTGKPLSFKR